VQRHAYRDNLVVLAVLLELEGVVALIAIDNVTKTSREDTVTDNKHAVGANSMSL
jgi:hypothetical protein